MQPVKFEDLVDQALRLSPDARADLVRRLAASLPDPALDAPDSPRFAEQAARQSRLVASSVHAAEDQAFIDALSAED